MLPGMRRLKTAMTALLGVGFLASAARSEADAAAKQVPLGTPTRTARGRGDEPTELPDDPGRARRHHAVHRGGEQRQLEPVRTEGPADVDVVRVARAPRGHYRDVIEAVCAAALLATTDLYFHGYTLGSATDGEPA